jgi:hypothetical protein
MAYGKSGRGMRPNGWKGQKITNLLQGQADTDAVNVAQLREAMANAGGGSVDSVVGTADRITVDNTDPANPVVDISSAYDTAIANAIAAAVNAKSKEIILSCSGLSPADSTTYYFGIPSAWGAAATTALNSRNVYLSKSVTIKEVAVYALVGGTIAGSEDSEIYLETYNPATNTVISTSLVTSAFKFNAALRQNYLYVSGLNISLTQETYLQAKLVCPVFAPNPTSVTLILYCNAY